MTTHVRLWRHLAFLRRLILIIAAVAALTACATPAPSAEPRARLAVAEAMAEGDTAGFARAVEPLPFVFPRDHGPHPEYAIEWWYYTGNLQSPEGRR
ncbi:MAG: carotenoid 1,2-hydratase, partial [Roseiflexus sp.]|nr:carotenoid 1,2-hydratase [Roseiflexus sp.]